MVLLTASLLIWANCVLIFGVIKCSGLREKPIQRRFRPLLRNPVPNTHYETFRVLQFNILADGLSGLRSDLGAFSRAIPEAMAWETRKYQLLHEILQYDPDCITLQECDHYYDFFLPKLTTFGYDGVYAPKPASACLEVSENSDGCAIFVKRSRLRIASSETVTYALSKGSVDDGSSTLVMAMNQVGLIVTCDVIGKSGGVINGGDNPLVVSTTHLKAKKSEMGEKYRDKEVNQLLQSINKTMRALGVYCNPLLILTGDLNAAPDSKGTKYESMAYRSVKENKLGLRSLLNDDVASDKASDRLDRDDDGGIWTTWKARWKKGVENVAKNCIDYILYVPFVEGGKAALEPIAVLDLFKEEEIGEMLLPNSKYPSDHVAIAADFAIKYTSSE